MDGQKPDVVVLAAAKSWRPYPADFLLENLKIQTHVIESANSAAGVGVSYFLGIHPKCLHNNRFVKSHC